jgi:hypothetical protein
MKPRSFTSSPGGYVGRPWEIVRGGDLTADGRIIDVYTKTGNVGEYTSILALIPDYDLVMAINMAGPESSMQTLQIFLSQLVQAILPLVDQVSKDAAVRKYAGSFTFGTNSSIKLSVDEYGLRVNDFTANGIPVASAYAALTGGSSNNTTAIRLYPTGLTSGNRTAWRAIYQTLSAEEVATFEQMMFFPQGSCQTWTMIDRPTYGMQALDYFVLEEDKDGVVQSVEAKAWDLWLERK